jgi:hypothetical protein
MRRRRLWFRQPGNVSSNAWIMASLSRCHRLGPTGVLGLALCCAKSWAGYSQSVRSFRDHRSDDEVPI